MNGLEVVKLLGLSLVSVFFYSIYVKCFRKLSQTERAEGLASHQKKNGTITMGGILFIVLPLFFVDYSPDCQMIILAMVGFGVLGVVDDLLIVFLKKNDGIPATIKLVIEIAISAVIFYFYLSACKSTSLDFGLFSIDLKWFFGVFILWFITASSNAWNLMDGVDGLCAGCSLMVGIGLMYISYRNRQMDIFYFLLALHITLFIFWCFNLPKAFLFMGDVGSLALGAVYALCSIYLNAILPFTIMAALYIWETLSVIMQVAYFKKTGGKRIFKMAPFHHHLEASGLKEIHIDLLFYLIQFILVMVAIQIS